MSIFVVTSEMLMQATQAFNAKFEEGKDKYKPYHPVLACEITSTGRANAYGFLEDFPALAEWIGARQLKELSTNVYTLENKTFEGSIQVKRENFEDNDFSQYSMVMTQFGRKASSFPDKLMFEVLRSGHLDKNKCIDGLPFFCKNHTVGTGVYSNLYGVPAQGVVNPRPKWYLFDTSQGLKPFIYQNRRPIEFSSITDTESAEVFLNNRFLFGIDGRLNVGYGMWQLAAASYSDLTPESFEEVYDGMMSVNGASGDSLEVFPTVLVVPVNLRSAAERLINRERLSNGESNPNYKRVEIIVTPYLNPQLPLVEATKFTVTPANETTSGTIN